MSEQLKNKYRILVGKFDDSFSGDYSVVREFEATEEEAIIELKNRTIYERNHLENWNLKRGEYISVDLEMLEGVGWYQFIDCYEIKSNNVRY